MIEIWKMHVVNLHFIHRSQHSNWYHIIVASYMHMLDSFDVHRAAHRNIISIVKPTRCTSVSNLFYFGMTFYMFRTVFPSIIRSSRLYIQQPNRYCCMYCLERLMMDYKTVRNMYSVFFSVPCNSPWYTNYKTNYLHQCIVLKSFTI